MGFAGVMWYELTEKIDELVSIIDMDIIEHEVQYCNVEENFGIIESSPESGDVNNIGDIKPTWNYFFNL